MCVKFIPRRDGLVVSVSASHTVGRGFESYQRPSSQGEIFKK